MSGTAAATESPKSPHGRKPIRIYRGWWIVLTGFLCQLSLSSSMGWVFSILLLPMETDLGWSRTELVGVLTVASLLYGFAAAPLGPVVDRYGSRWTMTIGAFVSGACLISVNYVSAPWQYYLALGFGLSVAGASLQNLGPVPAIANWFVRKRAHAFTLFTLGSPVAGMLMVPFAVWLISLGGWRIGWIALGLLTWSIAPLAWFVIRRRPEDVGLLPDGDTPEIQPDPDPSHLLELDRVVDEPLWTVHEALRSRAFWMLVAAMSLLSLSSSGFFIHMAPSIAERGFSSSFIALALSLFGFVVLVARIAWGFAMARLGIRIPLLAFGVAYGLAMFLFNLPTSAFGVASAVVLMAAIAAANPLFQSQVFPDYFGRHVVGSLMGYSGIFITIAQAFSPLFIGILRDFTHSYTIPFIVFAVVSIMGGLVVLMVPSPRTRIRSILASLDR